MFSRESITVQEWGRIMTAPSAIGSLVVRADQSGPAGMDKEYRAILGGMKEYLEAHAANGSLMTAMQSYLVTPMSDEEEEQLNQWAGETQTWMRANLPEAADELTESVYLNVAGILDLLRSKGATDDDLTSYKSMLYAVAEAVANASVEGGFLGFGGVRISDGE